MNGQTLHSDFSVVRRAAFALFAAALFLAAAASFLEASYWKSRLSAQCAARCALRLSASGEEYASGLDLESASRTFDETKERLLSAASSYLETRPNDADAQKTVELGLARWGVEGEENRFDYAARREADALASQSAIDALSLLDDAEDDSALDAALSFLRELDSEPLSESDSALWTFAPDERNPLDSIGVVSRDDFEADALVQSARLACAASARLFFLLTPGMWFYSLRVNLLCESALDVLAGLASFLRAIRRFFCAAMRFKRVAAPMKKDCRVDLNDVLTISFVSELSTVRLLI